MRKLKSNRLKRSYPELLLVLCSLVLLLTACDNKTKKLLQKDPYKGLFKKTGKQQSAKLPYKTLALVNIDRISSELLDHYSQFRNNKENDHDVSRKQKLNDLVDVVILAQKAQQLGLHKSVQVREQIRLQRLNLLANIYLHQLKQNLLITENDLQAYYTKRYLRRRNIMYKTRHIIVKDKQQASALLRSLVQGEDFAKLARKHSTGPSAEFGGALEWFRPDTVDPRFARAVIQMRPGELKRTPVKTRHGWHIIKLEATKDAPPPPLKEVKARLFKELQNSKLKKQINRFRKRSNITMGTDHDK